MGMAEMTDVKQHISEGESLLIIAESLKTNGKPLPGSLKLTNRIKSELRFLSKLLDGKIPLKPSHITSSNLGSMHALLHVVNLIECDTLTAVLNSVKDGSRNSLCIDVVANNGLVWIKVIARNAIALNMVWKGQGQFGERTLLDIADDYLRAAQCNPVNYQIPKVVFYFTKGVPGGLANKLVNMGVLVDGEIVSCTNECSDTDSESDYSECTDLTIKLQDILQQNFPQTNIIGNDGEITKVNLDISSMLTLVSNLSNGFSQYTYGMPVLDEQANQERESRVLPKLETFLKHKTMITCETALRHFNDILKTIGGTKEKERANLLLEKLTVVADDPSPRTSSLISSSKLNERAKIIFGTGDQHKAVTVTANVGFVRAALQNGVRYSVFEHEPRALTERKERQTEDEKLAIVRPSVAVSQT